METRSEKLKTYREAALQFVNAIRETQGREPLLELPKGWPGSPRHCPIAEGINGQFLASVGGHEARYYRKRFLRADQEMEFQMPDTVHRFVAHFDMGEYPDLVIKEWLDTWAK